MPYLGIADASGIQNYIFRNAELRAIADASQTIEKMCLSPNGLYYRCAAAHKTEVMIAAGGNASFRAIHLEDLKATFRAISRELLEGGTGLEIIPAIVEYQEGKLAEIYQQAVRQLERRKLTQPRNTDFQFPGLERPAESVKREQRVTRKSGYVLPNDLSKMIAEEVDVKTDLMAIVSIDGLGMGSRLLKWMEQAQVKNIADADFCTQFALWSDSITDRWALAWENALSKIEQVFEVNGNGKPTLKHQQRSLQFQQETDKESRDYGAFYLPCRKIYQGGDDLSFVCDARIALSLTAFIVRELETLSVPEGVDDLFHSIPCSAGVLFTDSHFPFIRAVLLSESVRKAAKKASTLMHKDKMNNEGNPPSYLDWWLNRQGAMERPEPAFPGATQKPYPLHTTEYALFSWETLETDVLPGMWSQFASARNKLKDLQAAAETGDPAAVRRQMELRPVAVAGHENPLTTLTFVAPFQAESGFNVIGDSTILLDVIELYDIHFPFPR